MIHIAQRVTGSDGTSTDKRVSLIEETSGARSLPPYRLGIKSGISHGACDWVILTSQPPPIGRFFELMNVKKGTHTASVRWIGKLIAILMQRRGDRRELDDGRSRHSLDWRNRAIMMKAV